MNITQKAIREAGGELIERQQGEKRIYRLIKGFQAKNYDGTPAGFVPGTPEGEREIIEQETIRGKKRRYSNWW